MKKERSFLIILLVLFCIIAFNGFKYISSLRSQNIRLASSIDQIMQRISVVESNNTMEKIVTLKSENATLKRQIADLKTQLVRVSKRPPSTLSQESKKREGGEETVFGNRGFLIKNGIPTR